MNPKNWSAKAQMIAMLVIPILVAIANKYLSLHIGSDAILALLGLGAVGAAGVAHIDNGEPPDVTPPISDSEKAAAKSLLPPALAAKLGLAVLACAALVGCATSPQTSTQPATIKPQAELGQGRTAATAAWYKSVATSEKDASLSPETQAVGAKVEVPFALWNSETKSWQIPLDKDGKPYMIQATAVRDFTYIVAGTVSNSATVSGTASGSQTQGGTAGATSGQTATPTTTVSPTTDVSVPVK